MMVLTGTISPRAGSTSDVNCRLVEVHSGRVLFSESYSVPSAAAPAQPRSIPRQPGNGQTTLRANAHPVGAIAHWTLDGNGKNALGDFLNGRLIGRPTFGNGPVNQALVLNGRDQYFSVAHDDAFDVGSGDFSIALWVRLNGDRDAESNPIASKGAYGWKTGWVLDLGANRKPGVVRLETKGNSERAPGFSQTSTQQNVVSTGKWHHIAVVVRKSRSGQNTTIYVDGNVEATGHVDQVSLDNPAADFYIGRVDVFHLDRVESVVFFRGAIDDVWLFRGAISEAQVRSLMSNH